MRLRPTLALVLLALAAALAWWLLPDGPEPHTALHGKDALLAQGASPTLAGRPEQDGSTPAVARAEVDTPPRSDGRRWLLEVEYRVATRGFAWGLSWEDVADAAEGTSPFAGRAVRVELQRAGEREVLARGVLDAHGRTTVELPRLGALTPLARCSSRLHVVPESEDVVLAGVRTDLGTRRVWTRYAIPPARPETNPVRMRLIVPAFAGPLVRGRAVGADGAPAAHAHVSPYSADGGEAPDTCTDERGAFAFPVSAAGTFQLTVSAKNGASVQREGLRFAAHAAVDLGTLRLRARELVFGGRITYPDGKPVVGLRMEASHTDTSMHVSYAPPSLGCQTYGIERSARTDAEGRFRLYPGWVGGSSMWFLHADRDGDADVKLADGFPAGSREDLDGVLHGHRIRWRVHDETGAPVHDARIALQPVRQDVSDEDPQKRKAVAVRTDLDGRADTWLTHGSHWTLGVIATGGAPLTRVLTVPAEGNESERVLELAALDLTSGVRVALRTAEGQSLMPAVLTVRTPAGAEVWSRRVEEAGFFLALAPGAYTVHLWSIEQAPWASGRHRWQHYHGEAEVPREGIVAVEGAVAEAAHVRVVLRLAAGEDPRSTPYLSTVILERPVTGRTVEAYVRMWRGEGEDTVSADLEPGAWIARLDADGFRPVTRQLDLRGGELTRVEFILDPR